MSRVVLLILSWLLPLAALAAQFDPAYKAPRGPGGVHPDLNGIWQALNEANYDLELHMARSGLQEREGPHGPVPAKEVLALGAVASVPPGMGVITGGGRIPYTDAALAQRNTNRAQWAELDPEVKCYLPGVPRATYMPQPFQIFQGEGSVFIAYQWAGAVRDIYFEDPGPPQVDSWMGQSVGRWEGDTLVVEANGFNGQAWLDRSGNHASWKLKVTERYTPVSPYHLWYEATIEDPETFTEPWTIEMPLYRRMDPGVQLMDFKCVEFVEELLYGKYRRHPLD
ncbi:MAG: hypothetical protein AB7I04_19640 [Pseudomonadales bacterium]